MDEFTLILAQNRTIRGDRRDRHVLALDAGTYLPVAMPEMRTKRWSRSGPSS